MRSDGLKEGSVNQLRFHEYKGLKRVLSVIIIRESEERDELKSKEELKSRTKKKKKRGRG